MPRECSSPLFRGIVSRFNAQPCVTHADFFDMCVFSLEGSLMLSTHGILIPCSHWSDVIYPNSLKCISVSNFHPSLTLIDSFNDNISVLSVLSHTHTFYHQLRFVVVAAEVSRGLTANTASPLGTSATRSCHVLPLMC